MSEQHPGPDRREFLQAGAGAALAAPLAPLELTQDGPDAIPRKRLGNTGEQVSAIGLGGHAIGLAPSYDVAERIVHEALDAGVNFLDNAWEYHQGRSEEWMGRAIQGRRNRVFLMTKVCTHGRDKAVALRQLDESLRRLRTDHLDLWQVHEVIYYNDPDLARMPDGVLEALDQAKRQGKTRFVGFTGHKDPSIHLRMLATGYAFDTVQMPLNCFDATFRSFEQRVLPEVRRRNLGALGMKSMGGNGQPVMHGIVTAQEALRYAMSLPVATTISGMDSLDVLRQNLAVARGFRPLTAAEMSTLRQRCAPYAADGHLELYKSTMRYDGDVGREQHGFPSQRELPM